MNYEVFKNHINREIPSIPKLITEEWLNDAFKNQLFQIWGFSFCDLSNNTFDNNISKDTMRRIAFSTKTILPKDSLIKSNDNMYEIDPDIKELHNNGVTGEGINVAVIDYGFNVTHNEIIDNIVEYTKFGEKTNHFHGTIVSSLFVGKKIGVAPSLKLYFYEVRYSDQIEDVIRSLYDIYEKNKNGANIRVINISASLHRESDKFDEIVSKLEEQQCLLY